MALSVEKLERLTVVVHSPDGNLKATANSERVTRFRFRDGVRLETYDDATLAHQISAVLAALNQGRQRGIEQVRQRPPTVPNQPHWDADRRRYHAALDALTVEARSNRGLIRLRARDRLARYQVRIHPQAPGQLDTEQFLTELRSAHVNLLSEHRHERSRLIREHLPR